MSSDKSALQVAFDRLDARLEKLYGSNHKSDFQDELDQLEAEIVKSEVEIRIKDRRANDLRSKQRAEALQQYIAKAYSKGKTNDNNQAVRGSTPRQVAKG